MTLVEGVMGYQAAKVTPPKTAPRAAASLPVIMISPSVAASGSMRYGWLRGRLAAAHS